MKRTISCNPFWTSIREFQSARVHAYEADPEEPDGLGVGEIRHYLTDRRSSLKRYVGSMLLGHESNVIRSVSTLIRELRTRMERDFLGLSPPFA